MAEGGQHPIAREEEDREKRQKNAESPAEELREKRGGQEKGSII